MFRLLIGVSGVGAATARMMLSSLTVEEIEQAIFAEIAAATEKKSPVLTMTEMKSAS